MAISIYNKVDGIEFDSGTEKSYLPNMDMKELYGLNWGLQLRKGTLDKIIFRVQDDLTGLTTFNAIATGTRI